MLLAALLAAAPGRPAEGQQAAGPELDGQIAAILEDMVIQKQQFRPEGLHALGVEGLSAVLDELLPDTAAPRKIDVPPESIRGLIAQLGAPSYRARETAFDQLVRLGSGATPYLEEATRDADAEISWRAHRILRKWEEQKREDKSRYVPAFMAYVSGIQDEPRLGELARRVLAAMSAGPPMGGRHQILTHAIRTIAAAGKEEITGLLKPLLAHQDVQVAALVVHAVGSVADSGHCPQLLLDAMRSDRMEVASAALNYAQNLRENPRSAEIKQTLVGILEGNDTNLQLQASSPLWHAFRYPQALDFLLELAKGADKNLRYQALSRLMNNYGHDKPAEPRLVKAVAPLLKDEDDNTRRMAALALSTYDGEEVVRSLIPLLADKYSIIPQELSGRLLEQSDKDMLRRLLTAAANTESSGEVRKAAAAVLEKLSGQ